MTKYDVAYMNMAEVFAQTSEATRLKVGCLLVKDGRVLTTGVNGTPAGWHTNVCEDETGKTSDVVNHAEYNALAKLWISHDSSEGSDVFVTHAPCLGCAIKLVEAKVSRVFYRHTYRCNKGLQYLESRNIEVNKI